jgi:hypothetical protein
MQFFVGRITVTKLTLHPAPAFQKLVKAAFPYFFYAVGCHAGSRIMDDTIPPVNPGHIYLGRLFTPGPGQIGQQPG